MEVYEKASGLKLATRKFTLARGGKETVSVRLEKERPAPVAVKPPEKQIQSSKFFITREGGLTRKDPDQTEMFEGVENS